MSDGLIERLETLRKLSRDDSLTVVQQNTYSDHLDDLMAANFDEILAALRDQQTLRGIEGLAKESGCVMIQAPGTDGKWHLYSYNRGNHKLDTLPLAVDAAVAGMKGDWTR